VVRGQNTDTDTDTKTKCHDRSRNTGNRALAGAAPGSHVHSVACGTPAELELPAALYDLSVAASLIPCSRQKLKRFLHDPQRRHLYPARYRLDTVQNARLRRRIRLLYGAEINLARRHLLRRRGLLSLLAR
jgi:hypothetical protein